MQNLIQRQKEIENKKQGLKEMENKIINAVYNYCKKES